MKNGVGNDRAPMVMHFKRRNRFFTSAKILAYEVDGKRQYLS